MSSSVVVRLPARLHLCFLDPSGSDARRFGSIGLPLSVYAPVLLSHLPFALRAAKGLAIKLHESVASTSEIILRPFEARLSGYLLQSAQGGVFSERLIDVAEQLWVSYRHLLRALKSLCEEGVLEKRKDGYHILKEPELHKKAAV